MSGRTVRGQLEALWRKHGLPDAALREAMELFDGQSHFDRMDTDVSQTSLDLHLTPKATDGSTVPVIGELQRYQMRAVIAAGATGEIWRVYDCRLERELAMKVMKRELVDTPRGIVKFLSEARLAARLQHPGLVPVHDMGSLVDGRLFFTMPEIRGRTLKAVIAELHAKSSGQQWGVTSDGFTLQRLVDVLRRACKTVAYAHNNGIIHRDLKPANIMLGTHDEVLVVDWGSAFLSEEPRGKAHRTVSGTPAYMAPEQAVGKAEFIDERTDVYALGATLFALLVGQHPWHGRSLRTIINALLEGEEHPRIPDDCQPGPPSGLALLSERALSPNPADRVQSAQDFAVALERWLDRPLRADPGAPE